MSSRRNRARTAFPPIPRCPSFAAERAAAGRRRRPPRPGRCEFGKVRFPDHESAVEALHAAAVSRSRAVDGEAATCRREVRAYECASCRGWHLTSKAELAGSPELVAGLEAIAAADAARAAARGARRVAASAQATSSTCDEPHWAGTRRPEWAKAA
ncbi:hypothetical protein USB125703_01382 [Pseudoclavibacter triregionum]|nr:hypothetical protein USB125703_01382 [Pseudoclavibacter triregionum]